MNDNTIIYPNPGELWKLAIAFTLHDKKQCRCEYGHGPAEYTCAEHIAGETVLITSVKIQGLTEVGVIVCETGVPGWLIIGRWDLRNLRTRVL